MLHVLVIDDDETIREALAACLRVVGCRVTVAATADAALAAVTQHSFELAFLDLRLGETSGLDLLAPLLATQPALEILAHVENLCKVPCGAGLWPASSRDGCTTKNPSTTFVHEPRSLC